MKKHFALGRVDGGVEIMETPAYAVIIKGARLLVRWQEGAPYIWLGRWVPVPSDHAGFVFATPRECIAKWPAARRAEIASVRELAEGECPTDRAFRGAWKDTGRIEVDIVKARAIQRDRMREVRAPKLAALDAEYLRAHEKQDAATMEAVAAKKQALRDVTADPAIEAARTPEELKGVWPEVLR